MESMWVRAGSLPANTTDFSWSMSMCPTPKAISPALDTAIDPGTPTSRIILIELRSGKPVILCGDLNVAHREIDLANPKTNRKSAGFTDQEGKGISSLLAEGFLDTFRHLPGSNRRLFLVVLSGGSPVTTLAGGLIISWFPTTLRPRFATPLSFHKSRFGPLPGGIIPDARLRLFFDEYPPRIPSSPLRACS